MIRVVFHMRMILRLIFNFVLVLVLTAIARQHSKNKQDVHSGINC